MDFYHHFLTWFIFYQTIYITNIWDANYYINKIMRRGYNNNFEFKIIKYRDFKTFLFKINSLQFSNYSDRIRILMEIHDIQNGKIINKYLRFPEEEYFIVFPNMVIDCLLDNLVQNLDVFDINNEAMIINYLPNMDNSKVNFYRTKVLLQKILFVKNFSSFKIFNRETFENHFSLVWGFTKA